MNEEPPVVFQPAAEPGEEAGVVAHVLEHLDRDDPVEATVSREVVDVGGDDVDIAEPGRPRLGDDVLALRGGVGQGDDAARRKAGREVQRQRSPAAPEFEDLVAICDPGPLGRQRQHSFFGFGQRLDAGRPPRAAVLEARTEDALEERGRQFVMLRVGGLSRDRNRFLPQAREQRLQPSRLLFRAAGLLIAKAAGDDLPDAHAQHRVRQEIAVEQLIDHCVLRGNQGRTRWSSLDSGGSRRRGCARPAPPSPECR